VYEREAANRKGVANVTTLTNRSIFARNDLLRERQLALILGHSEFREQSYNFSTF